jgi:hypothetical protein
MKRRVIVEEFKRGYGDDGKATEEHYQLTAEVTGTEKVVAGFLRALADEIDPPKASYS